MVVPVVAAATAASAPTLDEIITSSVSVVFMREEDEEDEEETAYWEEEEDGEDEENNIIHDDNDDDDEQSRSGSTAASSTANITITSEESLSLNPSSQDGNSHEEEEENIDICCICVSNKAVVSCSTGSRSSSSSTNSEQQQQAHKFCTICLSRYSLNAFMRHGDYERTVFSSAVAATADSTTRRRSECGQLPCPFFKSNECDCVAFSNDILQEFLNEEALLRWRQADARINALDAAAPNEQENISPQDGDDDDPAEVSGSTRSALEIVQGAAQEALTIARRTLCPACQVPGEKDAACMHITCPECRTCWCYCCGRQRRTDDNVDQYCNRSCDAISPCLQNNPGWLNFAMRGEEPGEGALHEFHRRRAMYYLRCIYEVIPMELWLQLQRDAATNNLLRNEAAGPARCITWHEIQTAQIPVFGSTRPNQVLWLRDGHQLVHVMLENLTGVAGRQSIQVNSDNGKDCDRHPSTLPSAPPQQQNNVATTTMPQEEEEMRPNALVPLHTELLRRYRAMEGNGWIWTIALISLCCALSIFPEYDLFRFWAGVTTCILVMTLTSYMFVSFVEINLERVQRTGALGGQPFEELLFLGSQQVPPYLCSQGALRNLQWPHALTLWGSLFFAALFSGPTVRTEFPGVGVGLWTLHFMIGIISPLLFNTIFRPVHPATRPSVVRVVMSMLWGWIVFPVGMYMRYRAKSLSRDSNDAYWGDGFLLVVCGVMGVLTEIYLCLWAAKHPEWVLKKHRIILSYIWSFSLAMTPLLFHIGRSGAGWVLGVFVFMTGFMSMNI